MHEDSGAEALSRCVTSRPDTDTTLANSMSSPEPSRSYSLLVDPPSIVVKMATEAAAFIADGCARRCYIRQEHH